MGAAPVRPSPQVNIAVQLKPELNMSDCDLNAGWQMLITIIKDIKDIKDTLILGRG